MFYRGYIQNTTKEVWLSKENKVKVEFTPHLEEAIVFHDLEDAFQTTQYLNDSLPDCFTLIDDDTYTNYFKNELVGSHGVDEEAVTKMIQYLNIYGLYSDVLAEVEYDKDEGRPIVQIKGFEDFEEKHIYYFETNGEYLSDNECL